MNTFSIYEQFEPIPFEKDLSEAMACAKAKQLSIDNPDILYTARKDGSALDGKSWAKGEKIPAFVGLTGFAW